MRFASLCSGIEAATVAWSPLGWSPAFLSEIDPHARALLDHRHPGVPNLGDMTAIDGSEYRGSVDLVVGGTPCQSFSVAGLRAGLDDERGLLAFEFLRIVGEVRPRWVVWENVPGVLSLDEGRAFGAILGRLAGLGYGFAYRVLDAQWVRVQSHPRAVPQRRRRVFVVGYLGDWRPPAAVLLERESLHGHPAPRREAGKAAVGTLSARASAGGGLGTDFEAAGGVVAHTLRGKGFDASEDGTGRGTPLIAMQGNASEPIVTEGGEAPTLDTKAAQVAVVFSAKDHGADATRECAPTIRAMAHDNSHANGGGQVAVAFDTTQVTSAENRSNPRPGDPCHPLAAGAHPPAIAIQERATAENPESGPDGKGFRDDGAAYTVEARGTPQAVAHFMVRRITPREAERLFGFPDDYTLVPYRGKPMADGPRYRLLGNSMAVNVMSWIGQRIATVDAIMGAARRKAA